nr:KTSC domain-containing protein [Mycolicibacterium wolinskyi]
MEPVDSSNVSRIGYDAATEDLYVEFSSGRIYVYSRVPQASYEELLAADSKGSYMNREIKPNYDYRDF